MSNAAGTPDLTICFRGMYIAIEVKRPGCTATQLQRMNIHAIRAAGGLAFVFTSVEQAERLFTAIINGLPLDDLFNGEYEDLCSEFYNNNEIPF